MPKITIDKDKCIGCGLCIENYPEVFEWGDFNIVQVKSQEVNDKVNQAVENCPLGAIRIE